MRKAAFEMRISDWSSDVCSSDLVDGGLVLEGELGDRSRQREDDMELGHRQQLGLAGRQPRGAGLSLALETVPVAAGIVGVADEAARGAQLDAAAEIGRASCKASE